MLARRAGLDKALAEFPDDVAAPPSRRSATAEAIKRRPIRGRTVAADARGEPAL